LFFDECLIKLEDNGNRKQDTGTSSDSTHEISNHTKGTNTHTTERCSSRNVTIQNMNQGGITVSLHNHLVITKLLGNITSRSSRDLNPGLGEKSTSRKDEDKVEYCVERIVDDFSKGCGWGDVVCNSSNRDGGSTSFGILPFSEKTNEDVGRCTVVKKLRYEVKVGYESSLEDDGHVGCVEKLDGVGSSLSTVLLVLHGKIDTPSLEVDDDDEDEYGSQEIGQVGKVLTIESLLERTKLITSGDHQVEECNNSSFEFSSTSSVEGGGTECLPDDGLTNIGCDEERNTRSKTVSFLKQLIKSQDNKTSNEKLYDNEDGVTSSKSSEITIHSRNNVCYSLTDGDEDTEELLCTVEECSVLLDVVVDLNDSGSSEELHDKSRGDDGGNSEFHEGSTVGSEDHAHPVEWIRRFSSLHSVDWDLATYQEDEEGDGSPQKLFSEGNL
jgi:hypothetical protein